MQTRQSSERMVGQRLRQARRVRGLSQKELSGRLKIHRNSLARYERGERGIEVELLERMATELSVSLHWLVTGEGEMDAAPRVLSSEHVPVEFVPVLGSVPAGFPRYSSEVILKYLPMSASIARHPRVFALIVHGDSMHPRLSDGDYVIVYPDPSPPNRAIVVALIDGETTIKELKITSQGDRAVYVLVPANPDYPPHLLGERDRIIGRVVAVQKMLE